MCVVLIGFYGIKLSPLYTGPSGTLGTNNAGFKADEVEMLVIPDGRKSASNLHHLRAALPSDNIDSMYWLKGWTFRKLRVGLTINKLLQGKK